MFHRAIIDGNGRISMSATFRSTLVRPFTGRPESAAVAMGRVNARRVSSVLAKVDEKRICVGFQRICAFFIDRTASLRSMKPGRMFSTPVSHPGSRAVRAVLVRFQSTEPDMRDDDPVEYSLVEEAVP